MTTFSTKPQRPAEEDLQLVWPWVQYRTFLWLQRDDDNMSAQLGIVNQVFGAIFGGDYVIPAMPDDTVMQAVRPWLLDQAVRFGRAFKLCDDFEEALDAIVGAEFRVKGEWRDADGVSLAGYNLDGYNAQGRDEAGRDVDGLDEAGYDESGFGRDGFNRWTKKNDAGLTREQVASLRFDTFTRQFLESLTYEQKLAILGELHDQGVSTGSPA